jgi:hypothetical protein
VGTSIGSRSVDPFIPAAGIAVENKRPLKEQEAEQQAEAFHWPWLAAEDEKETTGAL